MGDFTFAASESFVNYQNEYFAASSANICSLEERKLRYQGNFKNIFEKFSHRQRGLPSKTKSERKRHQKEIEKLQQIFNKKQQRNEQKEESEENKFETVLSPKTKTTKKIKMKS